MVMAVHHHPVVMVMMMPAVIAMHIGTRVHSVMVMPDHHFLGTCNRRCGNGDRAKRCNNKSKLLHDVPLRFDRDTNIESGGTFPIETKRFLNSCSSGHSTID